METLVLIVLSIFAFLGMSYTIDTFKSIQVNIPRQRPQNHIIFTTKF